MKRKQECISLLNDHDFEQGRTVNTVNWFAKKSHEFRVLEGGVMHTTCKGGHLTQVNYANITECRLEMLIFDNKLNKAGVPRRFAWIVSSPVKVKAPEKRRAKMVEGFNSAMV